MHPEVQFAKGEKILSVLWKLMAIGFRLLFAVDVVS